MSGAYGAISLRSMEWIPLIINGDQMPLHHHESSAQKTLNFKCEETFAKENHMLSRERLTVFTQVNSESKFITPEFIFKGKGTRTKVNVADDIKFHSIHSPKKIMRSMYSMIMRFTQHWYRIYSSQ